MKLNRFMVVLSAATNSTSDSRAHDSLVDEIRKTGRYFDQVVGCYKGLEELALLVQCRDFTDVGEMREIAKRYHQESILLVDARDKAFLLYCSNPSMDSLGYMYSRDFNKEDTTLPESYTVHGGKIYYTV